MSSAIADIFRAGGELPTNRISNQIFSPEFRLRVLHIEHDDLDAAIAALLKNGAYDDLLITRLKKRKLQIKDEIACAMAESRLEPDQIEPIPVARAS